MPISVECRDCGAEYRVGDDKAGKKLKCKSCGTFIPIFAPDTDEFSDNYDDYESPSATGRKGSRYGSEPDYDSPRPRRRSSSRKKKAKSKTWVIILGAVGGVVAILVVIGAIASMSSTAQYEKLADDTIEQLEELASTYESVKDRESAKQAAVRIEAVFDRFEELSEREKKLPKISRRQHKKITKDLNQRIVKIKSRIITSGISAGRNCGGEPSFLKAIQRLQRVTQKMKTNSRVRY